MKTKEEVLQNCTVENYGLYKSLVKLPHGQQLDRSLYLEVKKAIEKIGGKWTGGKVSGFVFNSDPTEILSEIATGKKRNLKKEAQFFATPKAIAEKIVGYAEIKKDELILEPSAGHGAIIDAILKHSNKSNNIFYCEKDIDNVPVLLKKYKDVENVFYMNPLNDDFLNLESSKFDKIIANPPFSKNQDIDHIRKMYDMLADGGRIVTIASTHWRHSKNKKETEFRTWLAKKNVSIEYLPASTFKESGTQIETSIITINKN